MRCDGGHNLGFQFFVNAVAMVDRALYIRSVMHSSLVPRILETQFY
jgi:hypothetical protein